MMGKKCQVCDGPIFNGRCKLCGMPYRKDEQLYHLNERRSDHYRHATPAARKAMENMEGNAAGRVKAQKPETTEGGNHRNTPSGSKYDRKNVVKKVEKKEKSHAGLLIWLLILLYWFFLRR